MQFPEIVLTTMEEIRMAQQKGHLSMVQVQIVESRLNYNTSYDELIRRFGVSGRTALTHALSRTCTLQFWSHGMKAQGASYLSKYDADLFFQIIGDVADDTNCIPSMYAISLAYYLKKKKELNSAV